MRRSVASAAATLSARGAEALGGVGSWAPRQLGNHGSALYRSEKSPISRHLRRGFASAAAEDPTPDTDTDGDGTMDCNDDCPTDPAKVTPGQCGCFNEESDKGPKEGAIALERAVDRARHSAHQPRRQRRLPQGRQGQQPRVRLGADEPHGAV